MPNLKSRRNGTPLPTEVFRLLEQYRCALQQKRTRTVKELRKMFSEVGYRVAMAEPAVLWLRKLGIPLPQERTLQERRTLRIKPW
ncbi:hypothetical protein A3H11_03420 [Candidatus Uhrbacteria bacterium RIFCSPLOWO2_12_FULL_47_10]|nr:MAG: hypothetical protein A3H11_03420 [Candidatus Uhrbacteria bacterium RIFCSPLOWO2_12_FULL_47_10]